MVLCEGLVLLTPDIDLNSRGFGSGQDRGTKNQGSQKLFQQSGPLQQGRTSSGYIVLPNSRERMRRVLRRKHLQNYTSSTSSQHHFCTITFSSISLLIFTSAHLHLCSSSHPHVYISAHLHLHTSTSLLIFTSAHLHLCSTLCGDRACRMRETQARVRFGFVAGNPLRRWCASRARNAGESAIWPGPAQPSAEIVRVEGAKCRRERDLVCRG